MPFKVIAGIVGVGLLIAFIGPVAVKLKELSLIAVALIGVGMAVVDLWHSIRSKED